MWVIWKPGTSSSMAFFSSSSSEDRASHEMKTSSHQQAYRSVAISVKQEVPAGSHRFLHLSSLTPIPYYDQAGAQTKCGLQDFMEQYHGQPSLLTNICTVSSQYALLANIYNSIIYTYSKFLIHYWDSATWNWLRNEGKENNMSQLFREMWLWKEDGKGVEGGRCKWNCVR